MRHLKAGRNLGRAPSHRSAMVRNMVTSLFKHEQLETTDARAKELRQVAERMITLAKRGDLHARRQALATIREKAVVHKLFDELKDRFMDRQGGYVRIVKKENRKGDGALISIIQLLLQGRGEEKRQEKRQNRRRFRRHGCCEEERRKAQRKKPFREKTGKGEARSVRQRKRHESMVSAEIQSCQRTSLWRMSPKEVFLPGHSPSPFRLRRQGASWREG